MIRLLLALALVALPTSVSAQQAGTYNAATIVKSFSESGIAPVLKELGAEITGRSKDGEFDVLDIKFENGFVAQLTSKACLEDGRCVGLKIHGSWDKSADYTSQQDLEFTAGFNQLYEFTKSGVKDDGSLFIERYAIADHGITHVMLFEELRNFETICKRFHEAQAAR
jgi:hypothetical protein